MMATHTPILCRVCGRRLGTVRDFEGRVFTLCVRCEKALKAAKKRGRYDNQGDPRGSG